MCKEKESIVGHLLESCSFYSCVQGLELPAHRPQNLSEKGPAAPIIADTCVIPDPWPLFLELLGTQKVFPIEIMTLMKERFLDKHIELREKRKPIYWTITK